METEIKKLYNINKLFKAIPIKNRDVLLYLDWMNEDTYVGKGKILEILESKPIIFIDNPLIKNTSIYFVPKMCLCEIKKSDKRIEDLRTAAFVSGIRKLGVSYQSLGIFP